MSYVTTTTSHVNAVDRAELAATVIGCLLGLGAELVEAPAYEPTPEELADYAEWSAEIERRRMDDDDYLARMAAAFEPSDAELEAMFRDRHLGDHASPCSWD